MKIENGKYLNQELVAFWRNWFIVYDGKYNWVLFDYKTSNAQHCYKKRCVPSINTEFYSNLDNALDNLVKKIIK